MEALLAILLFLVIVVELWSDRRRRQYIEQLRQHRRLLSETDAVRNKHSQELCDRLEQYLRHVRRCEQSGLGTSGTGTDSSRALRPTGAEHDPNQH